MEKELIKQALIKCRDRIIKDKSNYVLFLCSLLNDRNNSDIAVKFIHFYKPSPSQFCEIYNHPLFYGMVFWWSYVDKDNNVVMEKTNEQKIKYLNLLIDDFDNLYDKFSKNTT